MVKIFAFHFKGFDRTIPRSAPGLELTSFDKDKLCKEKKRLNETNLPKIDKLSSSDQAGHVGSTSLSYDGWCVWIVNLEINVGINQNKSKR